MSVLTPADQDLPTAPVVLPDRDGTIVYSLGPAFARGETAIASATAEVDGGTGWWQILLTLADGNLGLGAWNAAAQKCFAKDTSCADGGMAIVINHQVIAAPVPQEATFDSAEIRISGNFTEAEAKSIAAELRRLTGGEIASTTKSVRLRATSATGWPMLLVVPLGRPDFSKSVEQSPPGKARLVATYTLDPSFAAEYDLHQLSGSGRNPGSFGSERGDSMALFWNIASELLPEGFHLGGDRLFCRVPGSVGPKTRQLKCVANLVDSQWGPTFARPGSYRAVADGDLDEDVVDRLVAELNGQDGPFYLWLNSGIPGSVAVSGGAGCFLGLEAKNGVARMYDVDSSIGTTMCRPAEILD